MPPLSPEFIKQIETEAEAYGAKYGWETSNGYRTDGDLERGYEAGATAYAHYKEQAERYRKELEEIAKLPGIYSKLKATNALNQYREGEKNNSQENK